MSLIRRTTAVTVLALAAASCISGTDERPPVAPSSPGAPQTPPQEVDPAVEAWFRSNVPAAGMRLVAGDQISVSVQGKPELSVSRVVPADGTVPLFRVEKPVNALSRTPQELEAAIAAAYRDLLKDPYVTVNVENAAPRQIYVVGAVKQPGAYPVSGTEPLTLLKALALAGGKTDQADLRSVTIRRIYPATGRTVSSPLLDLQSAMERGDERDNLIVEADDTIVVPDAQELRVTVLGWVERPGAVAWYKGMTLSRAITEAGGFKRFAKKSKIKVVRRGQEMLVFNFDDMLDGKVPDLELEARDVVYVDERWI